MDCLWILRMERCQHFILFLQLFRAEILLLEWSVIRISEDDNWGKVINMAIMFFKLVPFN